MAVNQHDADVQRETEQILFSQFQRKYTVSDLKNNPVLPLPDSADCVMKPDLYSESAGIIGEIYAHLGSLKPAQSHKIAADILKMLLYEKAAGISMKKYIVICSSKAEEQLRGKSHLAETIRRFSIRIEYLPLAPDDEKRLREAMNRQNFYPNAQTGIPETTPKGQDHP